MFWIMLALCFIGFMLMMMEVILPYGLSFGLGTAIVAFGIYLVWREDPETGRKAALVAIPTTVVAAVWVFRSGVKMVALKNEKGGKASLGEAEDPPIGELVIVTQPLRPTGTVKYGNRRLTARTLSPEIESPNGAEVRVCGRDSIYLLVEPVEPPQKPS